MRCAEQSRIFQWFRLVSILVLIRKAISRFWSYTSYRLDNIFHLSVFGIRSSLEDCVVNLLILLFWFFLRLYTRLLAWNIISTPSPFFHDLHNTIIFQRRQMSSMTMNLTGISLLMDHQDPQTTLLMVLPKLTVPQLLLFPCLMLYFGTGYSSSS